MRFSRRDLLAGTALALLGGLPGRTAVIRDHLPWEPNAGNPPVPAKPGPWLFFTGAEGRAVEAIADRIIPPDPETPGGKDSGCAVYIDRQMAGPYGRKEGLYNSPPFMKGTKQQGSQSEAGPAQKYREGSLRSTAIVARIMPARPSRSSATATRTVCSVASRPTA